MQLTSVLCELESIVNSELSGHDLRLSGSVYYYLYKIYMIFFYFDFKFKIATLTFGYTVVYSQYNGIFVLEYYKYVCLKIYYYCVYSRTQKLTTFVYKHLHKHGSKKIFFNRKNTSNFTLKNIQFKK